MCACVPLAQFQPDTKVSQLNADSVMRLKTHAKTVMQQLPPEHFFDFGELQPVEAQAAVESVIRDHKMLPRSVGVAPNLPPAAKLYNLPCKWQPAEMAAEVSLPAQTAPTGNAAGGPADASYDDPHDDDDHSLVESILDTLSTSLDKSAPSSANAELFLSKAKLRIELPGRSPAEVKAAYQKFRSHQKMLTIASLEDGGDLVKMLNRKRKRAAIEDVVAEARLSVQSFAEFFLLTERMGICGGTRGKPVAGQGNDTMATFFAQKSKGSALRDALAAFEAKASDAADAIEEKERQRQSGRQSHSGSGGAGGTNPDNNPIPHSPALAMIPMMPGGGNEAIITELVQQAKLQQQRIERLQDEQKQKDAQSQQLRIDRMEQREQELERQQEQRQQELERHNNLTPLQALAPAPPKVEQDKLVRDALDDKAANQIIAANALTAQAEANGKVEAMQLQLKNEKQLGALEASQEIQHQQYSEEKAKRIAFENAAKAEAEAAVVAYASAGTEPGDRTRRLRITAQEWICPHCLLTRCCFARRGCDSRCIRPRTQAKQKAGT